MLPGGGGAVASSRGVLKFTQVVLDGTAIRPLAEFYRELLGWCYRPGDEPPAAALGARLRYDRSYDPEEPLRVYADPAGHPFCIFVAS